jgi:ribosome maturation factor RimP
LDELEQIKQMAAQVLTGNDLYLVDVELKGSTGNRVIWIYVESGKEMSHWTGALKSAVK